MKGWRSDAKSLNDLSKFEARWPFRSLLRLFHALFPSVLSDVEAPFCCVAVNDFKDGKWLDACAASARAAAYGRLGTEAKYDLRR